MNKFPKINFIGNKEKIAKWITDYFPKDAESVFDAFSGGRDWGADSTTTLVDRLLARKLG